MFKRLLPLAIPLSMLFATLSANEILVEGKAAYFLPQNNKFQKIYTGGGLYGIEASYEAWCRTHVWASVDSFTRKGSSLGCHSPTRISMVPIGLGLKYFLCLPNLPAELYVGAGVTGTYVHMHDKSPYVISKISKWGVGGIAKVGTLVHFDCLFLDLFVNYSYCPIDFHHNRDGAVSRNSMNFGGWAFGLGIGYRFSGPR
jgi:outer membrane protein W